LSFSAGGAKIGSGNLYIKKFSDDSTVATINVVSGKESNEGTIIFDRLSLQSGVQYYINYDETAFKHTASDCGVSFNALAKTDKLSTFTIEAAPALNSFDVKSDPVEVGNPNKINPQSEIILFFNKPLRFKSTGTVSIYEADGTLHQAISIADVLSNQFINRVLRFSGTAVDELSIKLSDTPNINLSGTSLIINTTKDFKLATTYYVQVSSGALADSCGTVWTGISNTSSVRFTTDPGPTATVADITNSSDGIEVTFDREVAADSGTAKIYSSSDVELDSFGISDPSITLS
jgi:hypothetical protein